MQENKLSVVCEKVFDRCLAPTAGGEGCDNMTMILIQFKKPSQSGSSVTKQPLSSNQPSEVDKRSSVTEQHLSSNQPSEVDKSSAPETESK